MRGSSWSRVRTGRWAAHHGNARPQTREHAAADLEDFRKTRVAKLRLPFERSECRRWQAGTQRGVE